MDHCLPEGGHYYEEGHDGCVYCEEPFPVIYANYGKNFMPGRISKNGVWVPNGTPATRDEARTLFRDKPEILMEIDRNTARPFVFDDFLKDRAKWNCQASGHVWVVGSNTCYECGEPRPAEDLPF